MYSVHEGNSILCSVLIPAYNSSGTIEKALASVLSQKINASVEIIVCDDGSTDETVEKVESVNKIHNKIRIIKNKVNEGVGATRNHLIDNARGKWIAFLDADDIFLPEKLSTSLKLLSETEADVLFHGLGYLRSDGRTIGSIRGSEFLPATVFRKEALGDIRFNTTLIVGEDTDFFRRLKDKSRCIRIDDILTGVRIQPGSLTDKDWLMKRIVEHWHSNHDGKADPPSTIQEYFKYYNGLNRFYKLNLYRTWLGQKCGRIGAGYFFSGERMLATKYLFSSFALNPGYLIKKLGNRR